MARIEVRRVMPLDVETVWAALADLASHAGWMKDAVGIVFETDQHRGVGTVMSVETRVGPLRTTDVIEVTGWVEGRSIEVIHRGLVTGSGVLAVLPEGAGSVLTWTEDLRFPWYVGGGLTAYLARPVLSAIWRGNLRRLEETLTAP